MLKKGFAEHIGKRSRPPLPQYKCDAMQQHLQYSTVQYSTISIYCIVYYFTCTGSSSKDLPPNMKRILKLGGLEYFSVQYYCNTLTPKYISCWPSYVTYYCSTGWVVILCEELKRKMIFYF
jgi:hypothetical protein